MVRPILERHRCYVSNPSPLSDGSVSCWCATNRDHDEGSMDRPDGPYWSAGLAPSGYAQREQQYEREVATAFAVSDGTSGPQDARPTTSRPEGTPLPTAPQPVVTADVTWRSDREADVLFRAPDGMTYEASVRDDADGVTARASLERLLAHEQELYEARVAKAGARSARRETVRAMPSHPQDAPLDGDVFPLPDHVDSFAVLGRSQLLEAVRDAVATGNGWLWLCADTDRHRVNLARIAPDYVRRRPSSVQGRTFVGMEFAIDLPADRTEETP